MANKTTANKIEVKVTVYGRVQGVYYRASTFEAARERSDISGYVKNCPDGTVEAVFQGSRDAVEGMIQWCWTGSPSSSVTDVRIEPRSVVSHFNGFEVRY